jgi:cellulose synthase/poly-beta-1,6-N-acetylglucosamine synthase-like glycosyltransferase
MIYLAYIILIFTALQLLVALANLFTETHLPRTMNRPVKRISILIPARNEEKNIRNILHDLKKLSLKNLEVIVFNDQSEDKTADLVQEFVNADSRFRLINSDHLPEGWLGKNFACHSLAASATGEYMFFIDANVRISGNLIGDSLFHTEYYGSALVSIFPMQKIITLGEWVTVPNMNYILFSLLPLILVRHSRFSSLAAANGQFMLFRSNAYRQLAPHEKMKDKKVKDIAIARYFKKNKHSVSCLLGDERISSRMYSGFSESVNGFPKKVAEFFGGSYIMAILFWLVTTLGFIVVLIYLTLPLIIAYLTMYLLTRLAISLSGKQNVLKNLLCILPLQLSMGFFIVKSLTNKILIIIHGREKE